MENIFFECTCYDIAHIFRVGNDEDEIYFDVALNHYMGFWGRLYHAFLFVFGHKSKYGAFTSIGISSMKARELSRGLLARITEIDGTASEREMEKS